MLGKIKAALGFLGGLAGHLPKLAGIIDLLGSVIKVGMANKDAATVREACAAWFKASNAFRKMLDEIDQTFLAAESAVDEMGDGGDDITYSEIKTFLDEAADVPGAVKDVGLALDGVYDELKKLA